MKIVIDIPEDEYKIIKNCNRPLYYAEHLIKNGMPLLYLIKQAREEIEWEFEFWDDLDKNGSKSLITCATRNAKMRSYRHCLRILDKLIAESEERLK